MINEHRNRNFWMEAAPGEWTRLPVAEAPACDIAAVEERLDFRAQRALDYTERGRYITIGKGYPL